MCARVECLHFASALICLRIKPCCFRILVCTIIFARGFLQQSKSCFTFCKIRDCGTNLILKICKNLQQIGNKRRATWLFVLFVILLYFNVAINEPSRLYFEFVEVLCSRRTLENVVLMKIDKFV